MNTRRSNLAELVYGAGRHEDISKRKEIETWVDVTFRPWFADRVFAVDETIILRWLIILKAAQSFQRPAPHVDLLIAAVALENRAMVVTRNTDPFVAAGVPVINPWTGEMFNGV